jgi:hypothetical protein
MPTARASTRHRRGRLAITMPGIKVVSGIGATLEDAGTKTRKPLPALTQGAASWYNSIKPCFLVLAGRRHKLGSHRASSLLIPFFVCVKVRLLTILLVLYKTMPFVASCLSFRVRYFLGRLLAGQFLVNSQASSQRPLKPSARRASIFSAPARDQRILGPFIRLPMRFLQPLSTVLLPNGPCFLLRVKTRLKLAEFLALTLLTNRQKP